MKKFYFVLLLIAVGILNTYAQNTPDSFANRINYIFQHVDKTQISTGLLTDYGIDFLNLANYNGQQLHDSNYVSNQEWITIYTSLYSSQTRLLSTLPNPEAVATDFANNASTNGATGLAILHYNYNSYRDDAVSAGLVTISNDQIYDVANRGQSPYADKTAFAVSPVENNTTAGNDLFIFKTGLVYSNTGLTITGIEADKGAGFFSVSMNTPFSFGFSASGIYPVTFRISFSNSTQLVSHTKVFVKQAVNGAGLRYAFNPNPTLSQTISGSKAYLGITGSANVQVHLSSTNTTGQIRKPFIVVEGFDPWRIISPNQPQNNYNSGSFLDEMDRVLISSGFAYDFHNQVDITGEYDLVFVDFENGTDYIQRNAFVVDAVIRWVNSVKTVWNGVRQQNVIMGMSMGGLVTRYALRDMENNSINHECRLFISHDAPQNGANVPVGIQMAAQHLGSVKVSAGLPGLYLIPIIPSSLLNPFAQIRDLQTLSESPAAKQMLIQRVIYDRYNNIDGMYTISKTDHQNFQNEIDQLGWPVNTRNISVSNGICSNTLVFSDNDRRLFTFYGQRSFTYFGQLWRSLAATLAGIFSDAGTFAEFPLSLISTGTSLRVDIWSDAIPPNFSNEQIYRGDIYIQRKILFAINAYNYFTKSRGYSGTSSYAIDNSPAGVYDLNRFGFSQATIQNQLPDFFQNFINVSINHSRFSFVPRPSSLNVNDPYNNFRTDICATRLVCENKTNFSGYFVSQTDNEPHISFNQPNATYIFSQMESQVDCSSICPTIAGVEAIACTTSYQIQPIAGATYIWTTSPNLTINGPNTNNNVQVTVNTPGGFGWVQITVTAACGQFTVRKDIVVTDFSEAIVFAEDINIQVIHPPEWNVIAYRWYMDGVFFRQTTAPLCKTTLARECHSWSVSFVTDCGESPETYPEFIGCEGRMSATEYNIYPNPVKDNLIVVNKHGKQAVDAESNESVQINLYDFYTYQVVKQWRYKNMQDQQTLNVSGLKKGKYILLVTRGKYRQSQQIIIE